MTLSNNSIMKLKTSNTQIKMESQWYSFINEYKEQIPFKPLSVILEAFYWYLQIDTTREYIFKLNAKDKVNDLMK